MSNEGSPQVAKRTTRLSACNTPSKNTTPKQKKYDHRSPSEVSESLVDRVNSLRHISGAESHLINPNSEEISNEESLQFSKRTARLSASNTPSKNTPQKQMKNESRPLSEEGESLVDSNISGAGSHLVKPNSEETSNEGPAQVSKRTTRLSASNMPCKNTLLKQKKVERRPPSILDSLICGEESISRDTLISTFPGRQLQILELLKLFGPLNSVMLPIFLYGGQSSGKTSIILQIFRHLKRPFVYTSFRTCHSPRILFESILNQLLLHSKNSSNGYSSAKRCEKPADFVNMLKEALTEVNSSLRVEAEKTRLKGSGEQGSGRMIYLIFDNMELVKDWDKFSIIISMLFKLYDMLRMHEVGLIFISSASPHTYHLSTGSVEPIPVHFPEYTEDDLYKIFSRNQADPKLYSSFLDVILKDSCKITRCIDELSVYFKLMFEKYCEPLNDAGSLPNQDMKSKLYMHLKPHVTPYLNEVFRVTSCPALEDKENKEKARKKRYMRSLGDGEAPDDVDFHVSVSAKYLLISAFLASRNPATLDAALFDSTGGGDSRKRKRKVRETSIQQKENAEQELLMKGPGTFPLERLLAIFQCITSVAEDFLEEENEEVDVLGEQGRDNGLMSDVLLQLSTLCNANIIIKGGNCPLEGSSRYRSTVSEEMALKVARSVNFPLSKYLYRR